VNFWIIFWVLLTILILNYVRTLRNQKLEKQYRLWRQHVKNFLRAAGVPEELITSRVDIQLPLAEFIRVSHAHDGEVHRVYEVYDVVSNNVIGYVYLDVKGFPISFEKKRPDVCGVTRGKHMWQYNENGVVDCRNCGTVISYDEWCKISQEDNKT